jgi:hypothetical protein
VSIIITTAIANTIPMTTFVKPYVCVCECVCVCVCIYVCVCLSMCV